MLDRNDQTRLGRRALLGAGGLSALLPLVSAKAQSGAVATKLPETAKERQLREDFPWLGRYAEANAQLKASDVEPVVVFIGDSITERWQRLRPAFFSTGRICRGIGGQTTPQMVLRMMADVIALRPNAVHIVGGTNDIAGNTGPISLRQTCDNIETMIIVAKAFHITPLLGAVPPAAAFRWRPEKSPAGSIRDLNAMLRDLARSTNAVWIDYHTPLTDANGGMREGMSSDGVHPVDAGYAVMEKVVQPTLSRFETHVR